MRLPRALDWRINDRSAGISYRCLCAIALGALGSPIWPRLKSFCLSLVPRHMLQTATSAPAAAGAMCDCVEWIYS